MAKKRVKEEPVAANKTNYCPLFIWPWLLEPTAKTIKEWKKEISAEFIIFRNYFKAIGIPTKAPICKYSGDKSCRNLVKKKKKAAVLMCSLPEEYVSSCHCDNRTSYADEISLEQLELHELDCKRILTELADVVNIFPMPGFPTVGDYSRLLGMRPLSDGEMEAYIIVCSTNCNKIIKAAKEIVEIADGNFVMLVGHECLVSDNTIKYLKKEGKGAKAVGLNSVFHLEFQNPHASDLIELLKEKKPVEDSFFEPLYNSVVFIQDADIYDEEDVKKVHGRTLNAKENYAAWKKAALKLFEELDINNRNDSYFWKKNGKPRLYRFANKLREIHPRRNYFPAESYN